MFNNFFILLLMLKTLVLLNILSSWSFELKVFLYNIKKQHLFKSAIFSKISWLSHLINLMHPCWIKVLFSSPKKILMTPNFLTVLLHHNYHRYVEDNLCILKVKYIIM